MKALLTTCLTLVAIVCFSQTDFVAVQNGNWTIGTTWGNACTTGCTAGTHYPGGGDNAYTNGFVVTVNGSNLFCHNLFLEYNVLNGLSFANTLSKLTINGSLAVWDFNGGSFMDPTVDVVQNTGILRFTGGNIDLNYPDVILLWDHTVADFGEVQIDFGSGNTFNILETINIGSGKQLKIQSGTLKTDGGAEIHGSSTSTITISPSAGLETNDPVSGGASGSKVGTVTINGTLTTSSYVNANTLSIGASGSLNTSYSGGDQTEGWWFQSNRPAGGIINASGSVNFRASSDQNVYARSYGNLVLEASGTKNVVGADVLNVSGTLTINNSGVTLNTDNATAVNIGGSVTNSGTWTPQDVVTFNGTGSQAIGGTGALNFAGGLTVNKSLGTLTLNRGITTNGLSVNLGTLNLGSQTVTISGGNIDNDGTLSAGTGTVIITSATAVTGGVATSLNNVTVNSGGSFTAANNMVIGGTLTNNGTLNIPSGGNININGNLSNAGSFNTNNGTVIFGGSSPQTISGSGALALTNMVVNNTVSNNGTINLFGTLSLNSGGSFDADGSGSGLFTIKSTSATGGGRIGELAMPGSFSGNVTIERYISGPADWRYLSFPLASGNVGQWKAYFPVTGDFSDPSPGGNGVVCPDPGSAACASIYYYDAAVGTEGSYVAVGSGGSTASTTLDYRKGYSVYTYHPGSFTLSVTGTPVTGGVSIPLKTGWNLIPNPYPSAIDWDRVTTTNTTNTVYFTTSQGQFATYLKGDVCTGCSFNTSWTGEIATGQSFWIESVGATSISLAEASKVTNASFVRQKASDNYLRITLASETQEDDLIIRFAEDASEGLEYTEDALKKKNFNYINFSSFIADPEEDFAINSIPFISCAATVKLSVSDVKPGIHHLRFSELESLNTGYEFTLIDKYLASETMIENGSDYSFEVSTEPASSGSDRFELRITSPAIDVTRDLQLSSLQECDKDLVRVELQNSQQGILYLFKLGDASLSEPVSGTGGSAYAFINKSLLDIGLNKLSMVASSMDGCNAHIFDEALSVRLDAIDEISSVTPGMNCGEGVVTLSASGASDGSYRWYESENAIEPISGANTSTLITPVLSSSKIYYVTAVNASGCESLVRVPVEASIVEINKPEISLVNDKLSVNAKTGIQWLKNGSPIEGATSSEYVVRNSGAYSVVITANGCSATSDPFEFIVNGEGSKHNVYGYSLSPNPTNGVLYINGPTFMNTKVSIYDSKGRKLSVEGQAVNENQLSFDLSGARNGLYFVNIQQGNRLIQLKAIKKE